MEYNFWVGEKIRIRAVESSDAGDFFKWSSDYDDESDRFCDEIHFPSSNASMIARVESMSKREPYNDEFMIRNPSLTLLRSIANPYGLAIFCDIDIEKFNTYIKNTEVLTLNCEEEFDLIHIREAQLSDVEALHELYMKHLTAHPPEEPQDLNQWSKLLEQLIENPNYHLLVYEEDGTVVSSVTLIVIPNLTHNLRPYAVIENVVTHKGFRNKGYAAALMERASTIANENGCYKIMLMTGSKLESTLRFYERCGFNRNDKTAFIKWL